MRTCEECRGTGKDSRYPAEDCLACDGAGRIEVEAEGRNW